MGSKQRLRPVSERLEMKKGSPKAALRQARRPLAIRCIKKRPRASQGLGGGAKVGALGWGARRA